MNVLTRIVSVLEDKHARVHPFLSIVAEAEKRGLELRYIVFEHGYARLEFTDEEVV